MTPERWRQVEAVFSKVQSTRDVTERERLLDSLDPDFRRDVEVLLAREASEATATIAQSGQAIAAGILIGQYRIESQIGEGGMGSVYLARDTKLNRPVAVKFLSEEIADVQALRRFQREAQTASSLNHPHIVTVHDIGEYEGRHYLVTEYIDGGTLKEWVQAGKRSWLDAIELLIGVADGLATAHEARILHRDIKPANILIAKNGYAKLADFGLAKLIEGGESGEGVTRKGVILGTIPYMSPEQASGRQLDARSDVFSFSVVLYEILAGKRPFRAATDLELLKTIIHAEAPPLGDDVPQDLRGVIQKALAKNPAERYQTMREMVADLRRLTRQQPALAAPKPKSNWPVWAAASAAVAAVALGALWFSQRGPAPLPNPLDGATYSTLTNFPGDELYAAISRDGKNVLFLSDRDGTRDLMITQVGSGKIENLTKGRYPGGTRTGWPGGFTWDGSRVWVSGPPPKGSRLRTMPSTGGDLIPFLRDVTVSVQWSPDGKRIVYFDNAPAGDPLYVADADGSNQKLLFTERAGLHNHFPVWSPDGRWIYFLNGDVGSNVMDLWRISSAGGAKPERLTYHYGYIGFPVVLDDRTILYIAEDTDLSGPWPWAYDVSTKTTRRIPTGLQRYASIAASADSRRLVVSFSNQEANLWSVPILSDREATEADVKPYPVSTARALTPRFHEQDLFYLSSLSGGDALWRSTAGGQASQVWQSPSGGLPDAPVVSPDGRQVAVVVKEDGRRRAWVVNADGSLPHQVSDKIDVSRGLAWRPDGKMLAVGGDDGTAQGLFLIPSEGGEPQRILTGPASDPVWSPDGSLIVYTGLLEAGVSPLKAVRPDGSSVDWPAIQLTPNGERARFLPDGAGLIYMQGAGFAAQDFYLLDLVTQESSRLTQLSGTATMRSFDIMPGGKAIVFDRIRENGDLQMIELPAKK